MMSSMPSVGPYSSEGITSGPGLISHRHLPDAPPTVTYMGLTSLSGDELLKNLGQLFKKGTYDLLRKNCNSFSDCALFFLLDSRLDPNLRCLEQLGHMTDKRAGIIQKITGGDYRPNKHADGFTVDDSIKYINKIKSSSKFGFK
eukprot:TRINITY_DN19549_c0_g1_i3.p1 TRINITY_DN19549_c0_g1~~TRINITY_DN19549_c0_g1_i3.p1  ORF type:complete len:144 (+),score=29.51 TRINITY_DN19549_c0_g1_i3:206-637(+)